MDAAKSRRGVAGLLSQLDSIAVGHYRGDCCAGLRRLRWNCRPHGTGVARCRGLRLAEGDLLDILVNCVESSVWSQRGYTRYWNWRSHARYQSQRAPRIGRRHSWELPEISGATRSVYVIMSFLKHGRGKKILQ